MVKEYFISVKVEKHLVSKHFMHFRLWKAKTIFTGVISFSRILHLLNHRHSIDSIKIAKYVRLFMFFVAFVLSPRNWFCFNKNTPGKDFKLKLFYAGDRQINERKIFKTSFYFTIPKKAIICLYEIFKRDTSERNPLFWNILQKDIVLLERSFIILCNMFHYYSRENGL